jgi:hypothetical protein
MSAPPALGDIMRDQVALPPLETLFETKHGRALKLTPNLTRLYGNLRMPQARFRQHVFSNFVTTLDGVVSLQAKGHAGGADISGFSVQDRMVMGLLRAIADVVIVGSGTLDADRHRQWKWPDRSAFASVHIRSRASTRGYNDGRCKPYAQAKGASLARDPRHSSLPRDDPREFRSRCGRSDECRQSDPH